MLQTRRIISFCSNTESFDSILLFVVPFVIELYRRCNLIKCVPRLRYSLILVFVIFFRYYAIVHPLSAMKVNSKSRTRKILAATWIIPIIICSPYLYCESFSFTIYSEMGEISRQTCNDRFDELDGGTGNFRKGYFIFLFIVMYFLPMVVIVTTCTKIARCLVTPITIDSDYHGTRDSKRRHEVSKRKVTIYMM